jgi:hypothetical protein
MRQALDTPTLSTDDHLKFQGLDAHSGAQLMDILSCEMDHRLPTDLPTKYGTVAALSTQIAAHINEMEPEVPKEKPVKKAKPKAKKAPEAKAKGGKAKAKGKSKAAIAPSRPISPHSAHKKDDASDHDDDGHGLHRGHTTESLFSHHHGHGDSGSCLHFSRRALLRIVQQVGFFMRDQDPLVEAVLAAERKEEMSDGLSVRQSRYVSVTDKLFELADNGKHDHCSFVLAVVLFHMAMRALCLRVMYHRAATAIQVRYRYLKTRGAKSHTLGPVMLIQRCWRGCRAALWIMYRDNAAAKIQHSYRFYRWNQRADVLLNATLKVQRVWLGAIHRKWLRHCHASATFIQKIVRASQVRVVFDEEGRDVARSFQTQANELMKMKGSMSETQFIARMDALVGKMRSKLHAHRENNIQQRRMQNMAVASPLDKARLMAIKGSVQPMRISEFEPMVFTLAKMQPTLPPRYGAQRSRVLSMVYVAKKELEKTLPREAFRRVHAAAKRGRAAVIARRLSKKPKLNQGDAGVVDRDFFLDWAQKQFEPKRF